MERCAFFVSPARSGHSIIGQLLCAHADVQVSDELAAVSLFDEGLSADQVYALIRTQDLNLQARGRAKSGYDYRVRGTAQNRADKRPRVIGDGEALPAVCLPGAGVERIADAMSLGLDSAEAIEGDVCLRYVTRR